MIHYVTTKNGDGDASLPCGCGNDLCDNFTPAAKTENGYTLVGDRPMYGICAYEMVNDIAVIHASVPEVSDDLGFVRGLVHDLNESDVSPIHLSEIVDDALYSVCF